MKKDSKLIFDDGGTLLNTNVNPDPEYRICFKYEDEQGNEYSTLTLAAGENKLCTLKNYIFVGELEED